MAIDTTKYMPYTLNAERIVDNQILKFQPGQGTLQSEGSQYVFGAGTGSIAMQFIWTGTDELHLQIHNGQTWYSMDSGKATSYRSPYVSPMIELPMVQTGDGLKLRMLLDTGDHSIKHWNDFCAIKVYPLPGRELLIT